MSPSHLQRCFHSKTLQSNLPTVSVNNFFNFNYSACAKSCWSKWINDKMAAQQSSMHKPHQGHEGFSEQDRGRWSFYDDQKNSQCCQGLDRTPESEPKTGIFLEKGIIRCISRGTAAKLSIKTAPNCKQLRLPTIKNTKQWGLEQDIIWRFKCPFDSKLVQHRAWKQIDS